MHELLDSEYTSLWQLDFDSINTQSPEVELLFQLAKKLEQIYTQARVTPTDTLITKVFLGTLCCTPAYDQLFIDGVKAWCHLQQDEREPKFPAKFGRNSYRGLLEFYRQNKKSIREAQAVIAQHGIAYPVMKLVDMHFWNLGYLQKREQPAAERDR